MMNRRRSKSHLRILVTQNSTVQVLKRTFPWSDIFFKYPSNEIDRMEVKVAANLFVLNM
jgi:hypothetical protein